MKINIPEQIKTKRRIKGYSQRELGELLGRNRDHIKDIENGRKKCSAEDYLAIMELLFPEQNSQGAKIP